MKTGTYGWKSVFAFTFRQTAKSKAFKVSSVIIVVLVFAIALLAGALPAIIGSRSTSDDGDITGDGETLVGTVYFADTTGITTGKDYEGFLSGLGVKINDCGKDADIQSLTEKVKGENKSLLIVIRENKNGYDIYASRPGDESVSSGTANGFGETFKSVFDSVRLSRAGLTDEQITAVDKTVSVYQSVAGEPTENDFGFVVKMVLPMLSSVVLFMLIFIYGQMVAQSIAQEKTSKVMELLLTSVRPLAIIIGKILAMGSLALIQFMMIVASGVLGIAVSVPLSSSIIGSSEETGAVTSQLINEVGNALGGSPVVIALIIVVFIVGFIFFALIAGLIGATVSRMEDLNAAMQPMSVIGVLGFYLAYFPSSMGGEANTMALVSYYLPISSPFSIPSALLTGAIDIPQALLAVLVLCVFVVLMALLVARVYEQIILHTGNRLKLGDILGLVKSK